MFPVEDVKMNRSITNHSLEHVNEERKSDEKRLQAAEMKS
jgi:hypothetical protein